MDLSTGIGILIAISALVVPMTPAFQNGWVVASVWLGAVFYATFLAVFNWSKIAEVIAAHPRSSTVVVGAYAFIAIAGAWHTYVLPLVFPEQLSVTSTPALVAKQIAEETPKPFVVRLPIFAGSNSLAGHAWWVSRDGSERRRVQVMVYLKIVNVMSTPITVEAFSIEMREDAEVWRKFEVLGDSKLFLSGENELAHARQIQAASLPEQLIGRRLQQNEGVEGWVWLRYLHGEGPYVLARPEFRVVLRDNTGKSYAIESVSAADYSTGGGEGMVGGMASMVWGNRQDISKIPQRKEPNIGS